MALETIRRRGKAKEALIEKKDQRWHCRNRITLVFGSNDVEELDSYLYLDDKVDFVSVNFHQAKSKAIEEILDNCIDEFYRGHVSAIHTTLLPDKKTVVVEDNGIGFPLDKIKQVYTEFRTGSKFKDEELDEKGFLSRTLGQNGLGAAATCLTCDYFKVRVRHYNSKKEQTFNFIDGTLKIKKSKIKSFRGSSGVRVELRLAKEVYKNDIIDEQLLRKRIIDLAYNNPGLKFYFNKEKYHYKKGLFELAKRVNLKSAQLFGEDTYIYHTVTSKKKKAKGKIDISLSMIVDLKSDDRERFISFANSTPTFDGGFHHDRVRRLFINAIKEKLARVAKKEKFVVVDNDILSGITFVLGITMPNPRFESQTKRKLVRDHQLEKGLGKFMNKFMAKFIRKNNDYLDAIMERARSRVRFMELKEASKQGRKQRKQRVEKLLDANERKNRENCVLFICEGDSAIGGLRSARDKLTQGGIALRGKPMNVTQSTVGDILSNQEFSDIMASIGLTIGEPPNLDRLRYHKIVFLSDSDVDGGHINTLLANFFFTYWPELFEWGMIQYAKAPLFELITEKGREFIESPKQLEKIKSVRNKIKEIHRNKGLGEMSPEAFKYVLDKKSYTQIEISDKKQAKRTLEVCFGKDSGPRKDLLMEGGDGLLKGKKNKTMKKSSKIKKTTKKRLNKTIGKRKKS